MSNCVNCGQRLNKAVFNTDQTMKSCPRCSTTHGSMHVFHPYPYGFGTTEARVSDHNPDGIQSYCVECRTLDRGEDSHVYQLHPTCNQA